MKPAPFTYHRPASVDEALAILADVAEEGGRVIAGGQSLIPMMALRVAYPPHLIDINEIAELAQTSVSGTTFSIGALTRHARFHEPVAPGPLGPLMSAVAHHIAHYPIRQRGTFCGSLAHADPASEWCLVTATLDGVIVVRNKNGMREIPVGEYFQGVMATAVEPEEMLVEVRLPLLADDERFGFVEFNRRAGDFALGMSLVTLRIAEGVIASARVGLGGVEEHPRRIAEAEAELVGRAPTDVVFRKAAAAAAAVVEPLEDAQTSADYRRDLTAVVIRRALEQAMRDGR
ncbi:MAG TPA: FAD binding domain-containing protein [Noviherbaspirillum sp.]|nr:FAD binding domain-containing protein [Noviherbaspirillum sp.]